MSKIVQPGGGGRGGVSPLLLFSITPSAADVKLTFCSTSSDVILSPPPQTDCGVDTALAVYTSAADAQIHQQGVSLMLYLMFNI